MRRHRECARNDHPLDFAGTKLAADHAPRTSIRSGLVTSGTFTAPGITDHGFPHFGEIIHPWTV